MPAPVLGDQVHYVSFGTPGGEYPKTCRAAIITAVEAPSQRVHDAAAVDTVSLCVLNPEGMFFNRGVQYDEGARGVLTGQLHDGGTWHWPHR